MIKRNLGRMGETYFNNLCSTVGLTCNGSCSEDNTGWDFIVEYPHEYDDVILADKISASKEFKIQIKATDQKKRKLPILLSNLMRLCNTPLPSFILFLEYNYEAQPVDVFLVHINKEIIFKVLKCARENSTSKSRKKFNKKTLTINYDELNKINCKTGDSFIKSINSYMPRGMNEYVREKQHQLKTLGYEKSWGEMKFKASALGSENDLVSASLGWIEKTKITDVKNFDARFDILSEVPDFSSPEGYIYFEIKESTDKGLITFTHLESKKRLRFDCEIFCSQISAIVPKQMAKFRILTKSFDMLVSASGSLHYKFIGSNVKLSLFELRDEIIFRKWIVAQECSLEISIYSEKNKKSISIVTDKIFDGNVGSEQVNILDSLEVSVGIALQLAKSLHIESQVKISLNELRETGESLHSFLPILNENKNPYDKIRFSMKQKETSEKVSGEVICIIVLSSILGNIMVFGVVSVRGSTKLMGDLHTIGKPSVILEALVDVPTGENNTQEIKTYVDSIVERYREDGLTTIDFFNSN